ncbi:hypothetical protein KDK_66260 [Dictyobacter kobayashii]|uniref:Uncharacterized protein n=2 Tax=Dictyobacter kobayashii TaxID=2014872 RepID=A0A402AUL6_9CHLR|nr:hypothetical protein KDK_66260 [Dictyobacter kobayashii]
MERLADIKKIAVLRANAAGDFIFMLPAMEALHHTYPDAEIVLLGQSWHATFLHGRPSPIDRVIIVPAYKGINAASNSEVSAEEQAQFFSRMQAEHFDLALQMQSGGKQANEFLLKLKARVTAGLSIPDAPALDRSHPYTIFQHEMLRCQEIVSLVGVPKDSYMQLQLVVTDSDLEESLQVVPEDTQPLVALYPGGNTSRYRWPGDKFARIGDALAREGAHIVITGTAQESELTAQVVREMQAPALELGGQLTASGLCGLFSRCRLVIANDSVAYHLANATGTTTIGIYWCINMLSTNPLNRQRQHPFISWQLNCPTCGHNQLYRKCGHPDSLVADISSDDVLTCAKELLKVRTSPNTFH